MSTYSLLQLTLDQTISREDMENAAAVLETLARPDIAKLHRELFGIVASGLQWEEANAFHLELEKYSYPAEVVADEEVPILDAGYRVQRITMDDESLAFTDAMGRQKERRLSDLLFLAGGFLQETEEQIEKVVRLEVKGDTRGTYPAPTLKKLSKMVVVPKFRLDFFFATEPYRVHVLVIPENVAFFQDLPLRLRHPAAMVAARQELSLLLPPERLTCGMLQEDTHAFYPNLASYEEEIRWRFHRLLK